MNRLLIGLRGSLSASGLGRWQFTLAHLFVAILGLSVFLSCVACHWLWGIVVFGGFSALGLLVAGSRYSNAVFLVAAIFMSLLTIATVGVGLAKQTRGTTLVTVPVVIRVLDKATGLPVWARRFGCATPNPITGTPGRQASRFRRASLARDQQQGSSARPLSAASVRG